MSATSYENVPVFRSGMPYHDIDALVGKASVEIDEEKNSSTITIHAGEKLTEFLKLGTLKAFDISAMVQGMTESAAREYHEKQAREKTLWEQRTER